MAPITLTYEASNRLTTIQNGPTRITYTYDTNGNQISANTDGVVTGYKYDLENRLTQISFSDGSLATYVYGLDGLRLSRQEPGEFVKTQVWDGQDYLGEM